MAPLRTTRSLPARSLNPLRQTIASSFRAVAQLPTRRCGQSVGETPASSGSRYSAQTLSTRSSSFQTRSDVGCEPTAPLIRRAKRRLSESHNAGFPAAVERSSDRAADRASASSRFVATRKSGTWWGPTPRRSFPGPGALYSGPPWASTTLHDSARAPRSRGCRISRYAGAIRRESRQVQTARMRASA